MEAELRETIVRELPNLITQDPQIRDWVWHLVHDYMPPAGSKLKAALSKC